MTPASILSLAGLLITGGGILVMLGRVLAHLDTVAESLGEIRGEQRAQRDSIETLRREAVARDRDHAHLVDHIDTIGDRVARTESRLDTAPHGMPAQRPSR